MTITERILINEIEQLISHAENETISYSILEHARKLVFERKNRKDEEEIEGLELGEMNHLKEQNSER